MADGGRAGSVLQRGRRENVRVWVRERGREREGTLESEGDKRGTERERYRIGRGNRRMQSSEKNRERVQGGREIGCVCEREGRREGKIRRKRE